MVLLEIITREFYNIYYFLGNVKKSKDSRQGFILSAIGVATNIENIALERTE